MTASTHGSVVPITLTVDGRIGLTLWAAPWEDEDGEQWQGFLGEGSTILLFPSPQALAEYVAAGGENDLSDHPAWEIVQGWSPSQFRPAPDAHFDLDAVFGWASDAPDPQTVSALAAVVEMVAEIAECCDDGALKALVGATPEYAQLTSDDVSYHGRDGRHAWDELGGVVAGTWERAIARVSRWLEWRGDFSRTDLQAETVWDRVGAEPIELVLPDETVYTVRGSRGVGTDTLLLAADGRLPVFATVAGLARYCREATEHELTRLERWDEVRERETAPDEVFAPALDASFDLRVPSARAGEVVQELLAGCGLSPDSEALREPIDPQEWERAVADLRGCLQRED